MRNRTFVPYRNQQFRSGRMSKNSNFFYTKSRLPAPHAPSDPGLKAHAPCIHPRSVQFSLRRVNPHGHLGFSTSSSANTGIPFYLVGSRWAKIEIFEQKCSPGRMLWRKPAWWLNTRTIPLNTRGFWADTRGDENPSTPLESEIKMPDTASYLGCTEGSNLRGVRGFWLNTPLYLEFKRGAGIPVRIF